MNRLSAYKHKRKLDSTPEPKATIPKDRKELIFVIQKHHASHLHYDLRLELDGVLKSWAVPKGPPLSFQEKHLAIMVEDHPMNIRTSRELFPKAIMARALLRSGIRAPIISPEPLLLAKLKNLLALV